MTFDPYYKWLGIPPEEQPPHHYRLLGIKLLESDPDVIDSAADRQMGHLRTYQSGPRSGDSQRLMNEVSAARKCLLVADSKQAYDATLSTKTGNGLTGNGITGNGITGSGITGSGAPANQAVADPLGALPSASSAPTLRTAPAPLRRKQGSHLKALVLAISVAAGAIPAILLYLWLNSASAIPVADGGSQPDGGASGESPSGKTDRSLSQSSATAKGRLVLTMDSLAERESTWSIDGKRVSFERGKSLVVDVGDHTVRGSRLGYQPIVTKVKITKGDTVWVQPNWINDVGPDSLARVAADAEARAAEIASKNPGPKAPPSSTPTVATDADPPNSKPASTTRVNEEVDLLALIDPERHSINGRYLHEGPTLVTPNTASLPLLAVPYELPDEYKVTATVERLTHQHGFWLMLSRGDRRFDVGIDTYGQKASGIQAIDKLRVIGAPDRYEGPVLPLDTSVQLEITVRRDQILLAADGKTLVEFRGSNDRLSSLQIPDERSRRMYVGGSRAKFRISGLSITPLATNGGPSPVDFSQAITFDGHSYQRLPDLITWRAAVLKCREMGGRLLCIETPAELAFIQGSLQFRHWVWIGGHRTNNGKWNWLSGEPFVFAPWKQGEPNGARPTQSAVVLQAGGVIGDHFNTGRQSFICEWDSPVPLPRSESKPVAFPLRQFPKPGSVTKPRQFGGHTYALVDWQLSWHDAKLACEDLGGYLCCVENEVEQDFLTRNWADNGTLWLGGTDEETEGQFRWINGSPFDFTAWTNGDPNNFSLGSEHYIGLNPKKKGWNDVSGATPLKFLCEWDSPNPEFFRNQ